MLTELSSSVLLTPSSSNRAFLKQKIRSPKHTNTPWYVQVLWANTSPAYSRTYLHFLPSLTLKNGRNLPQFTGQICTLLATHLHLKQKVSNIKTLSDCTIATQSLFLWIKAPASQIIWNSVTKSTGRAGGWKRNFTIRSQGWQVLHSNARD